MQHRLAALLLILLLALALPARAVDLGIDVLRSRDFDVLRGKKVGLITNQTGNDRSGTPTRVVLKKALGGNLVALYSPEHGIDGTALAGASVSSRKDGLTGLPVFSLYGATRKPTSAMLRGVDVLVFDIQDIGVRSYTYISTMAKCMEAAGQAGIDFVVLDRPNPLGGDRVEGPPIESRWISFIGIYPIPYIHGMTAGELAQMANARSWNGARCKLTVIPMRGWSRGTTWDETGLSWRRTSPNIPRASSPLYYAVTSISSGLGSCESGCGGPTPFEFFQHPGLDGSALASRLRAAGYSGVSFTPINHGVRLSISPNAGADLSELGVHMLLEANRVSRPDLFSRYHDRDSIFWKLYGSTNISTQAGRGMTARQIAATWSSSTASFRSARRSYLLY